MRVVRVRDGEQIRLGVIDGEHTFIDVSAHFADLDVVFGLGQGLAPLQTLVAEQGADLPRQPLDAATLAAPIPRPHHLICIGLNYRDHAAEAGMDAPSEPVIFNKAPNTLVGPTDDIMLPRGATSVDWEIELGVVIGRRARYLERAEEAHEVIAGFVLVNDVSERDAQLHRGGQWMKGKSFETFNPCGPVLVTPDELSDPQALDLFLSVNGEMMQQGSTATMIFDVHYLVWYLSQFMVLEPGDLINTGTPAGVGMGQRPPRYLTAGDVIEMAAGRLGEQRHRVVAFTG